MTAPELVSAVDHLGSLPSASSTSPPTASTWTRACAPSCASRERELIVSVPVKMDDGSVQVFQRLPRPAQPRAAAPPRAACATTRT